MPWNWQLSGWPAFHFDPSVIAEQERGFLLAVGSAQAFLKNVGEEDQKQFIIEILTAEGEKSSRIEGEMLDRESLQSSIKKHFSISEPQKLKPAKEAAMAELLYDVYQTYNIELSHEMLWRWHAKLFQGAASNFAIGGYRNHEEPMQIVGHRLDRFEIFFEAPPSKHVHIEMERYLDWFNSFKPSDSILARAAIAHLYFENIHPFEDGNGRLGRAIVEKSLSQVIGRPILIAVSKVLEKRRKEYYQALQSCNRTLEATTWVKFFADAILQAQKESLDLLNFLIEKSKLFLRLKDQLNERQEKALLRLFREGPKGFDGGLSAEKYIAITGCSRASATRDLAELIEWKALIKTGELRYTRYWLNIHTLDEKK